MFSQKKTYLQKSQFKKEIVRECLFLMPDLLSRGENKIKWQPFQVLVLNCQSKATMSTWSSQNREIFVRWNFFLVKRGKTECSHLETWASNLMLQFGSCTFMQEPSYSLFCTPDLSWYHCNFPYILTQFYFILFNW